MPSNSKRDKKTRRNRKSKKSSSRRTSSRKPETVEAKTSIVPVELLTKEELERITRENSFMLNPMLANASLQKDLVIASSRTNDLEELHKHLFNIETLNQMDDKTLVSLYAVAVTDHHKTIQEKIKIAELSDKNRVLRDVQKYYAELEKRREIEATDNSHTGEIIQALLSESMRHAMNDEIKKKWNGSNSYRPEEKEDYEVLAIDPDKD